MGEGVVLQGAQHLRTANAASSSRGPIQLRRWVRQLAGRLVRAEEGLVLRTPWQGLPWSGQWLRADRHHLPSLRLDRWLERPEEAVVLRERRKGLPTAGWRLRLRGP